MGTYFTTITGNNQGIAMNPMLKSYHRNVRQVLPERFVIYISLDNAHFPKNEMPDTKWKISSIRWITARFPHINRSQSCPVSCSSLLLIFFRVIIFLMLEVIKNFLQNIIISTANIPIFNGKHSNQINQRKIFESYILFRKIEIVNWNSP